MSSRSSPSAARPRRTFIELREVPGLLVGVSLGDAAALRRVLGARRGGRLGVLLGLALLVAAAPSLRVAWVGAAAYLALGVTAALLHRDTEGVSVYQGLRMLLWTLPGPLLLAAIARLAGVDSAVPLLLAAGVAYLLLDGGLRAGLGSGSPGRR